MINRFNSPIFVAAKAIRRIPLSGETSANSRLWQWFNALPLVLAALALALPAPAEVINWTNTSNGNWSVASNWSPNQVPSTNDIAVITNDGSYMLTLNVNPTIAGLLLGGSSGTQTLATAGRTLTLNGDATVGTNGAILFSGGTLSGQGRVDLRGTITWNSGVLDSNAVVRVAPEGRITITSGPSYTKYLWGSVTNAGLVEWQPSGGISMIGTFHNLAGGLFDAQVDSGAIIVSGTNAVIINDGLFRKANGTGNINCYAPLLNNGTVDIQTGTLTLLAPSSFNSGCQFTGAGAVNFQVGTNTLNGAIYSENLTLLYSATLTGTGSFSGTLTWGGGSIGPDAAITVATNGHLLIGSTFQHGKTLDGCLTNAGTITWTPLGNLMLGGVLHNRAGAVFDIQTGNSILASGTRPALINDGTLRRSVDTGATSCQVPLLNSGTVDIQTGRLDLPDGSLLNEGSSFIGAGLTRMTTGTITLKGTISSENLELSGATLVGTGLITGSFTWSSGTIDAALSFNVTSNSILTISSPVNSTKFLNGNLTNAGTVIWQPLGSLLLGGVLHNLPGGLYDIRTDNTLGSNSPTAIVINDGILRKSAGNSTAGCGPRLINNGVLEISSGRLSCASGFSNQAGTISLAGGTFQNTEPIYLGAGLLTGWGSVNASVTNAGCIRPACSNGILTINGRCAQLLGGRMEFELAGNLPGTNQSRLNIAGAASLRGTVGVRWGESFVPSPGTGFPVMAFVSRDGEFCCFDNFLLLGQGRRLTPVYSATSLTLVTMAASEPTEVPLRVVVDGGVLVHWPVEFSGYELYWSTNLSLTNWTRIPGATNRILEAPPLAREKFFRLRKH